MARTVKGDGWNKPCPAHGEVFCAHCRDNHDIDLTVDKQLQWVRGKLLHRATKTEESDTPLPLPAICVTALQHRHQQTEGRQGESREAWHDTGMIFTTRFGLPVESRNFNRSYDSRIARADVPKITVHYAPRTCGSLLVDLDVHPRIAMAVLRHADSSITMEIYSQVSSKATREALRKLG
ncbi:hypothetical protein [Salinispora arenicola]|uniref:hypothetical protein n=1 Tax=Salinispora arenicola TaxID=168697 RepID=UPI0016993C90|nr:hypothetical protein [Salinispora arenicola]NIL59722.1 hypothetical protein [Salinispora arenicola]NIL64345.1 hypothetical protein [Salinispora arenicola]